MRTGLKALVASVLAGLPVLAWALTDGTITLTEWGVIVGAMVGTNQAVYWTPNRYTEKQLADKVSRQNYVMIRDRSDSNGA